MHQINYFWEAFNGCMNLGVIGSQFSDCSRSLWTHPIANIFVVGSNVVGCWSILSLRESEEMNGAPLFCVCNCNNYKFLWDITVNKKYYQLGRDQTLTGENTQKTEICFVLDLHCNIQNLSMGGLPSMARSSLILMWCAGHWACGR